jgi:hypothetical protein
MLVVMKVQATPDTIIRAMSKRNQSPCALMSFVPCRRSLMVASTWALLFRDKSTLVPLENAGLIS